MIALFSYQSIIHTVISVPPSWLLCTFLGWNLIHTAAKTSISNRGGFFPNKGGGVERKEKERNTIDENL